MNEVDELFQRVNLLLNRDITGLTPLGGVIVMAIAYGIAQDSRALSIKLDVAHALVLRECTNLEVELGWVKVVDKNDKSQLRSVVLTSECEAILSSI